LYPPPPDRPRRNDRRHLRTARLPGQACSFNSRAACSPDSILWGTGPRRQVAPPHRSRTACDFRHNVAKAATLWFKGLRSIYGLRPGLCRWNQIDYTNCSILLSLERSTWALPDLDPRTNRMVRHVQHRISAMRSPEQQALAATLCFSSALSATLCLNWSVSQE
jgi:hypothetical protein